MFFVFKLCGGCEFGGLNGCCFGNFFGNLLFVYGVNFSNDFVGFVWGFFEDKKDSVEVLYKILDFVVIK